MNSDNTFTFDKNSERMFFLKRIPYFMSRLIIRKFQNAKPLLVLL